MRVALFSDVHGNLVSLEAVLADIAQKQVDHIVCLGDVLTFGPQPREVLVRLKALGCLCVMGNHDLELLHPDLVHGSAYPTSLVTAWVEWCVSQLLETDLLYLSSFQPSLHIPLDKNATLMCVHGSPRSNEDFIFATTPVAELDEMLAGHRATVLAGGHTHKQMVRRHRDITIVNAGSVGCPVLEMPFKGILRYMPWSEYAVVNWVNGHASIELYRVSIDLDAVRQAALDSDMPHADVWVSQWITPTEMISGRDHD